MLHWKKLVQLLEIHEINAMTQTLRGESTTRAVSLGADTRTALEMAVGPGTGNQNPKKPMQGGGCEMMPK